jgi:hypothetical protein
VGGNPDAASRIAADIQWRAARGHDSGCPAAAPAGRALEIVRVSRSTVNAIVRIEADHQLRCVRLAEQDSAGLTEPAHDRCAAFGDERGASGSASRRDQAGGIETVLDGERNTVKCSSASVAMAKSAWPEAAMPAICGGEPWCRWKFTFG